MGKAVIDADFFIKMTAYDTAGKLFLQLMEDLDLQPVMHQYVAEVELKKIELVEKLLEEHKIQMIKYADYIDTSSSKEDYQEYFFRALMDGKAKGTSITLKQLNPTISNAFRNRRDLLEQIRNTYGT